MKFDYSKVELYDALKKVIKNNPEIIFISGNLAYLGKGEFASKKEILDTYINFIQEIAGDNTTIVTSTFTHQLINKDIPFQLKKTQSTHGVIANYFLQHDESVQSMHPFSSFCAIGEKANYICKNNTRHPYGLDSPYERMLSLNNPLTISIGLPPNLTCSIIHHVEVMMNVPYRYVKEFNHPIQYDNKLIYEDYYLPVLYQDMDINRGLNKRFFINFEKNNLIYKTNLGKSKIFSYNMKDFYKLAIHDMKQDIYAWLEEKPKNRPYRS